MISPSSLSNHSSQSPFLNILSIPFNLVTINRSSFFAPSELQYLKCPFSQLSAYFAPSISNYSNNIFLIHPRMSELQTLITDTSLKSALNKGSSMQHGGTDKTKAILRHRAHRCSQNCQRHRFTLVKIRNGRDKGKFVCDKYSVSHIFCPQNNERLKIVEGGAPRFNNDRRVETPAFILKFQIMPDDGSVYKERFKDFLARATNETLETSDQKCRLEYQRRCLSKGRYPEFQRKVEELRGMLTVKDERTAGQR